VKILGKMQENGMGSEIVAEILAEIKKQESPENAEKLRRFFKEPVECRGLTSAQVNEIVKLAYPEVKGNLPLNLEVAQELLESRVLEEASIGFGLLRKMTGHFSPGLFDVFDGWVDYLTNWANTDGLSSWLIAETVRLDPQLVERLLLWTASDNRWRRRAADVSLVPIARKGEMLDETFAVAEHLMADEDEMVQKGVGWLLKEASKKHPDEVREFLLQWKDRTSALVLRYASEKLPKNMRVLKTR